MEIYLAGAARTAIGGLNGAFAGISGVVLGSAAIKATIERSGVDPASVDNVIIGNILSAGQGQNPARQAAIAAGLPNAAGAFNVNKVCGSGLLSVILAAQSIAAGDASMVIAGGMESMTQAPYLLKQARGGYRLGDATMIDSMMYDGLRDAYAGVPMGEFADKTSAALGLSRSQCDDYAVRSYQRAIDAHRQGRFAAEIVPLDVPQGKASILVGEDEGPRKFDEEKLRRLKPAFTPDGIVTAGNCSSISDGAASLLVFSKNSDGIVPQAKLLASATASGDPEQFTLAPIEAVHKLLAKLSLRPADIDLFEINEAFAVAPMAVINALDISPEKVNVNGGAIALGHPIGASGSRILVTLIHALAALKARLGIAVVCIGGGEAIAVAIENLMI